MCIENINDTDLVAVLSVLYQYKYASITKLWTPVLVTV